MNTKVFLFLTCFLLAECVLYGQLPIFDWAVHMGGEFHENGNSIALDSDGNIYTTGVFEGTADFNPGPDIYNLTPDGIGDIFISKLNAAGNFIWAKKMGGPDLDIGTSIVLDDEGNLITAGIFNGTADLCPGNGNYYLTSAGLNDIYISKLGINSNFIWAKGMGGTGSEFIQRECIAMDETGNVYSTGSYEGTVDFDPGTGIYNLTALGEHDIFISKLGPSGNLIWAKSIGGSSFDRSSAIELDAEGKIYITGGFVETADFDPGYGTYQLTSAGAEDAFVLKLDSSGQFIWAKQLGGNFGDLGRSIAVDNDGNVYTTGEFYGTADFDPGSEIYNLSAAGWFDAYISKLDSAGNFVWAGQLGGITPDAGYSIALDGSYCVYTTGVFTETGDFDPGIETYNLTSKGETDIFISKLDANGNFIWAGQIGGPAIDRSYSLAMDEPGNIYVTGEFEETTDFDPGNGSFLLTSAGETDIFVLKLNQFIQSSNETLTTSGIRLFSTGKKIWVNGLETPALLEVFDLTGTSLGHWKVDQNNNHITLNYQSGIFIVRILSHDVYLSEKLYVY